MAFDDESGNTPATLGLQSCDTAGPFEIKHQQQPAASRNERRHLRASNESGNYPNSLTPASVTEDIQVVDIEPPLRRYDCQYYETCLDLAAALNWNSFTCHRCNGTVNESLYWRAHQIQRRDSVARALCDLRPITALQGERKVLDGRACVDSSVRSAADGEQVISSTPKDVIKETRQNPRLENN